MVNKIIMSYKTTGKKVVIEQYEKGDCITSVYEDGVIIGCLSGIDIIRFIKEESKRMGVLNVSK